jgi:hypothetical protein
MTSASVPYLSVIVPAHNGARFLDQTLSALRSSTLAPERWELVVVDDASSDETAAVAGRYSDSVVRLSGKPHGPAYVRNRGFENSRGEVLVFIDADVAVHPETLSRFAELFARNEGLSAAFGSYDATPSSPGTVSQYRNLLHHHVHQSAGGEAETFWAGCGAIRRQVFAEVGHFDESRYPRPQIEDIELGRRVRRAGHTILLAPEIQGTHLKHWGFWEVVRTDFCSRGVPWMLLILREGRTAGSTALNLGGKGKLSTALMGVAVCMVLASAIMGSLLPLAVATVSIGAVVVLNRGFYRLLYEQRGIGLAASGVPLHLMHYSVNIASAATGWVLHHLHASGRRKAIRGANGGGDAETRPTTSGASSSGVSRKEGTTTRQRHRAL